MAITEQMAHNILRYNFGLVAYNPPTTLYVGLSTTTPTAAGVVTEPVGNGYQRVAITNSSLTFTTPINRRTSNTGAIEFPEATPGGWGNITSVFIASAATGQGNTILCYANLPSVRQVLANTIVLFSPGSITFELV